MANDLLQDPDFADSEPGRSLAAAPLGFIDIGARGGVHPLIDRLAGWTAVLGFEPDDEECRRMQQEVASSSLFASYAVEATAIAGAPGTAQLEILASAVNTSLLKPNPAFIERYGMTGFTPVRTVTIPVDTLDNVVFARTDRDTWGELIKIDAQGASGEILRGGQRTLRERTVAALVEVEFFEMYQGEELFSEVEQFMRGAGFSFYGFDVHTRSAKLLDKRRSAGRERTFFADVIFLKDPLVGGRWKPPLSRRGQHLLFSCALLLGYHDFALQLALQTWAQGAEAERVRRLVEREASRLADRAYADVMALAERVRANPAAANVEAGKFVDARRHLADYDDVKR